MESLRQILFLQNRLGDLTIPISPDCSKLDIAVNAPKIGGLFSPQACPGGCLAVAGTATTSSIKYRVSLVRRSFSEGGSIELCLNR